MFSNASTAGLLISGICAGAAVQAYGTHVTLILCGAAALAGTFCFWAGSRGNAAVST
jgi:SET family sugar efflux transporter-like MFS transporter